MYSSFTYHHIKIYLSITGGSIILLFVIGIALDQTQLFGISSFYEPRSLLLYKVRRFFFLPNYFIAFMLMLIFNGYWLFKLAKIEGYLTKPIENNYMGWGIEHPINSLKLIAVNIVAIPFILIFVIMVTHLQL